MASALALEFPLYQRGTRKYVGCRFSGGGSDGGDGFPSFLPKEVHRIRDPLARTLAQRIQRLPVPVGFSESCIMSSCVPPRVRSDANPVVLLHCFDSSCLEWRSAYPLLEDASLEAWAVDILGWGFSDLERRPPCNVASKRNHLYQVDKLVLINANVYAKGTGVMTKLPKMVAYGMASLLKSMPLRWYAKLLVFDGISLSRLLDYTDVGRLHCLLPWWEDATVNFMLSGGYNVIDQIKQVKQKTLLICSERDKIVNNKLVKRLENELPNASMVKVLDCGHMPHIEKPYVIAKLIADFA